MPMPLSVPLTPKRPAVNSRSSTLASSRCAATTLAFSMTLSAARTTASRAHDERARAVGVHALGRDLRVAVQHLDVLERDPEPVGDDLAPRRLVALAVRRDAGDDLDLAGREHPDAGALPAAGAVVERRRGCATGRDRTSR